MKNLRGKFLIKIYSRLQLMNFIISFNKFKKIGTQKYVDPLLIAVLVVYKKYGIINVGLILKLIFQKV